MRPSVDQRLLQRIADSVPAIVALYNIGSGKYVYVNRGIARLLGYRSEDVLKGGLAFIAGLRTSRRLSGRTSMAEAEMSSSRVLSTALSIRMENGGGSIPTARYLSVMNMGMWHWY
jgi:PAS domain-containing protein